MHNTNENYIDLKASPPEQCTNMSFQVQELFDDRDIRKAVFRSGERGTREESIDKSLDLQTLGNSFSPWEPQDRQPIVQPKGATDIDDESKHTSPKSIELGLTRNDVPVLVDLTENYGSHLSESEKQTVKQAIGAVLSGDPDRIKPFTFAPDGKPQLTGETRTAFIESLASLGYKFESHTLLGLGSWSGALTIILPHSDRGLRFSASGANPNRRVPDPPGTLPRNGTKILVESVNAEPARDLLSLTNKSSLESDVAERVKEFKEAGENPKQWSPKNPKEISTEARENLHLSLEQRLNIHIGFNVGQHSKNSPEFAVGQEVLKSLKDQKEKNGKALSPSQLMEYSERLSERASSKQTPADRTKEYAALSKQLSLDVVQTAGLEGIALDSNQLKRIHENLNRAMSP